MKAFLVSNTERKLVERPIPSPGPTEVLIKNVAISSDPKDFKVSKFVGYAGIEGNNVAGIVEEVGSEVTRFKKGDKVGAFTLMVTADKYGAYAEYTVAPAHTTFHVGPKTPFEDIAAIPLPYATAVVGLFSGLGLLEAGQEGDRSRAILVYGGATTCGVYATQLLKKAGYYVVAVAGSSLEVAKAYGADEIIDYRNKGDDELSSQIASAYGGKGVSHIFDAVSEHASTRVSLAALGKLGGGKYAYILPLDDKEFDDVPAGVEYRQTGCAGAHGEDADLAQRYFDWVSQALDRGEFRPQKVTVIPNGLEGIPEGLRRLEAGEVRGEKLVYRLNETPGLS